MKYLRLIAAGLAAALLPAMFAGCGDVKEDSGVYRADADEIAKAVEDTPYNEPLRGVWVTPRMPSGSKQEDYNEAYRQVKEAGINVIFTYDEISYKPKLQKALEAVVEILLAEFVHGIRNPVESVCDNCVEHHVGARA